MTEQRLKLRGDGRSSVTVEPFARNIVIRGPKSILLQCNKSNCGLIFSCWRRICAAVVPAKAGTHNHRLWNMGPRLRGADTGDVMRANQPDCPYGRNAAGGPHSR